MKDKIAEAMAGIRSDNDRVREQHFQVLLPISEENPESLYEYWDVFRTMLARPEVSNKYYAIHLIANLARVDTDDRFEAMFEEFYALLDHESPVVSPHIAGNSGRIIRAKPRYEARIVDRLLEIDRTSRCRHIELQKAYVIAAFDEAFEAIGRKADVIAHVRTLLDSPSPKTRKAARDFLDRRAEK